MILIKSNFNPPKYAFKNILIGPPAEHCEVKTRDDDLCPYLDSLYQSE